MTNRRGAAIGQGKALWETNSWFPHLPLDPNRPPSFSKNPPRSDTHETSWSSVENHDSKKEGKNTPQKGGKTTVSAGCFRPQNRCTEVAPLCRLWVAPLGCSLTQGRYGGGLEVGPPFPIP